MHSRAGLPDRFELARQRMSGINFIVPVSADQHQMSQIRPGQQILQQVEGRSIEPLQIVEKQRQRMFWPGKDANEAPENELEAALRLLRLELRDRRLVSDDELQFGDEVGHEPCIQLERLQKRAAPDRQFGVALAEKRPTRL